MAGRRESDRRAQLGKRVSIDNIVAMQKTEKYYERKKESEDTKTRREIQAFIIKKYSEGRSKEETLKRLRFVYGGKQYAKYQPFFESWVNNFFKQNERTDEGEER